jgi:hypothetical protein
MSLWKRFINLITALLNDGLRGLENLRSDNALLNSDLEEHDDVVTDIAKQIEIAGGEIGRVVFLLSQTEATYQRFKRKLQEALRDQAKAQGESAQKAASLKVNRYVQAVARAKASRDHAQSVIERGSAQKDASMLILLGKTLDAEEAQIKVASLKSEGALIGIDERILESNKAIARMSGRSASGSGIQTVEERQAVRRGRVTSGQEAVDVVLSVRADQAMQTDGLTDIEAEILAQARQDAGVPAPVEEEAVETSDSVAG